MSTGFEIRATVPGDRAALMEMYPAAFPDEDLRDLVANLLDEPSGVMSLSGIDSGRLVANAIFAEVWTDVDGPKGALLGPLAVHPDHQKTGWGRAIVAEGEARLAARGVVSVFLLGDPNYYSRLGYARETSVQPPYALPDGWEAAWQSHWLGGRALQPGPLTVLPSWRVAAYWGH